MTNQKDTMGKTLTIGQKYDIQTLHCVGWTGPELYVISGYHVEDYFRDGVYLGPDKHGIEPQFIIVEGSRD